MFDRIVLAATRPALERMADYAICLKLKADTFTFAGFGFGLFSSLLIALGQPFAAILPLLIGRLCDGLDGAIARSSRAQTDRGAFLDIALDFLFYASVPLAFAIAAPERNALAGAVLLAAFIGTGSSFLAYAVIAAKRGEENTAYPSKGFYYLGGLTEGSETIAVFLAMCIWPHFFPALAYVFAVLCALTTLTRLVAGWRTFQH